MRRRMRRRTRSLGTVVQSFKKVLNFAPAALAAGAGTNYVMVNGVDSVAAGQTGVTDPDVPTGSVVKFIEIQFTGQNLVNIASFYHVGIQQVHAGQAAIDSRAVGGNPQRNQVFFQRMFTCGTNQNLSYVWRFKIPSKFQRVREGDQWLINIACDTIRTEGLQVIYKFYR